MVAATSRTLLMWCICALVALSAPGEVRSEPSPEAQKVLKEFLTIFESGNTKEAVALVQKRAKEMKGVECAAWNGALERTKVGQCQDELFLAMYNAGFRCGGYEKLFNAVCPKACKAVLLELKADALLDIAYQPTLNGREKVATLQLALSLGRHLGATIKELCDREANKEKARSCYKLAGHKERMQHILCKILEFASTENLRALQQAEPALFDEYHCAMTERIVLVRVTGPTECKKGEEYLVKLGQNRPLTCDMSRALTRLLTHHCLDALNMLIPMASPDDVADASKTFNETGGYQRGTIGAGFFQLVSQEVQTLVEANRPACESKGPESANCAAIQWLQEQMALIEAAKTKQESPEALLKDACEVVSSIAFEQRIITDNKNAKDEMHLYTLHSAQQALKTWQIRLDHLKSKYQQATGKEMDLGACKKP